MLPTLPIRNAEENERLFDIFDFLFQLESATGLEKNPLQHNRGPAWKKIFLPATRGRCKKWIFKGRISFFLNPYPLCFSTDLVLFSTRLLLWCTLMKRGKQLSCLLLRCHILLTAAQKYTFLYFRKPVHILSWATSEYRVLLWLSGKFLTLKVYALFLCYSYFRGFALYDCWRELRKQCYILLPSSVWLQSQGRRDKGILSLSVFYCASILIDNISQCS